MKKDCEFKEVLKRGAWTSEEDELLSEYIRVHGTGKWRSLPANAGLNRCGKSCRLRWLNYLRPDIKRGNITEDEEELIIRLHKLLGNKWSLIAGRLPGRTDNEIKNYWNTYLKKKVTGETLCQRSSSTVKTAFPGKQIQKNKEKSDTNVTRAKTLKCPGSIVQNQITVSAMKQSPKNVSETQTDQLTSDFTSNFAGHYDTQLNTTKDDVWITELMQNSDFHLPSNESSYTSQESLHNFYGNEISFNEEIYIRGLFNSGKIEDGTRIFFPDSSSLY